MQQGLFKQGIAELIGTFILTFIGGASICALKGGAESTALVMPALAHGFALMIAVYSTAHISGGSINPAVSIGLWIVGKLDFVKTLVYIVFECIGAILAGFLLRMLFAGGSLGAVALDPPVLLGTPNFGGDVSVLRAFLAECFATFILVWTVMLCAVDSRRQGKQFFGFCIGMAVTIGILAVGNISGGAMNPARYLGTAVASAHLDQAGIYWLGPIVGGVLAAVVYKFVFMQAQVSLEDEV